VAVLLEDERFRILMCGWQQLQFKIKYIDYNLPVSIFDFVCNYTRLVKKVTPYCSVKRGVQ